MTLRWTRGHTFFLPEHFFGKLQVPGDPDVEVLAAKALPRELEQIGARIEIRVRQPEPWPVRRQALGRSVQRPEADPVAILAQLKEESKPQVRLFVWEDADTRLAVTETAASVTDAKLRAEQVVAEMLARLAQRQGRGGYRGEAARAAKQRPAKEEGTAVDIASFSDDPEHLEMLSPGQLRWRWRLVRPRIDWYQGPRGPWTRQQLVEASDSDDMAFWREMSAPDVEAFLEGRPILADSRGRIIDGYHRLRAWYYHGLDWDGRGPPTLVGSP